jgi:hypothetical protein
MFEKRTSAAEREIAREIIVDIGELSEIGHLRVMVNGRRRGVHAFRGQKGDIGKSNS